MSHLQPRADGTTSAAASLIDLTTSIEDELSNARARADTILSTLQGNGSDGTKGEIRAGLPPINQRQANIYAALQSLNAVLDIVIASIGQPPQPATGRG